MKGAFEAFVHEECTKLLNDMKDNYEVTRVQEIAPDPKFVQSLEQMCAVLVQTYARRVRILAEYRQCPATEKKKKRKVAHTVTINKSDCEAVSWMLFHERYY